MVLLEADFSFDGDDKRSASDYFDLRGNNELIDDIAGADVRFRYFVNSEFRDHAKTVAATLEASLIERGAMVVKVEEVVNATTRARAPEIVEAQSLTDQLQVLWTVKNSTPEPERAGELLAMASDIERQYQETRK